jgi:hypothetical protein
MKPCLSNIPKSLSGVGIGVAPGVAALGAAVPSPGGAILSDEPLSCPMPAGADSPMGEMKPCLSNIPKSTNAGARAAEREKQPAVED